MNINVERSLKLFILTGLLFSFSLSYYVIINYTVHLNFSIYRTDFNLKKAGYWEISHIYIDDTDPNYNWTITAATYDWCSGNGTWSNPCVIENVTINAGWSGSCIEIKLSDVYFIIRNCTVYYSGIDPGDWDCGIRLEGVNNCQLINNTVSSNWMGILLLMSHNNTVSNNIVKDSDQSGIYIRFSYNNTVSGNMAINNGVAGVMTDGLSVMIGDNNIYNNTVNNNWNGIAIENNNSNVFNNTINSNTYAGLYLTNDDNNITDNIVESNVYGIRGYNAENNFVWKNIIRENQYGIYLDQSMRNEIVENDITDNTNTGVFLDYSNDNDIYKNKFIRNNINAIDDGIINQWDNGSLGNYWDDYTGLDADDDGIGDTPYNISGSAESKDNYPIWDDGFNGNPILIDGQASGVGAHNWTWAESKTWCSGSGSWNDPYIITNITIDVGESNNCIEIRDSAVSFIIYNCIFYNSGSGYSGIKLNNVNNSWISKNTVYNNDRGIYLSSSNKNTIWDNTVKYNRREGIHLEISANNTVWNNTVRYNDRNGIELYNSDYNTIELNFAANNYQVGIFLYGSSNNNILRNEANENINSGVKLEDSKNNTISGNTIKSNNGGGVGCFTLNNENNIITDNYISNNSYGVWLAGIVTNNLIYNNVFDENPYTNGYDSSAKVNYWDNGSLGNYWSDYGGVDDDDDGIGDTPYNIEGLAGSQDHYPIWWNIVWLTIISPYSNEYFEFLAPNFTIVINRGSPQSLWYTIDNGLTNFTFTGTTGTINQTKWDEASSGLITLIIYAKNSLGIINSSQVSIYKDIEAPYININSPKSFGLFGKNPPQFSIEIIEQSLDSTWYRLWNGTKFTINCTFEYLTDNQIDQAIWNEVGNGTITITFFANDSFGRLSHENVTVRKDIQNPIWDQIPSDQINECGISFYYDVNASDPSGIDTYWVNDTINFQINNNGIISNKNLLSVGTYWLEVNANDTVGNYITTIIKITVQDTTDPTWVEVPSDQTIEFGSSFYYKVNASDPSGIDTYWLNDTVNFQIDSNGIITNNVALSLGDYWLQIRAYDPYGNYIAKTIKITVRPPQEEPTSPGGISGYNTFLLISILSISTIALIIWNKKKSYSKI